MMAVRNKGLKMFTLALLFIITITSFLLNYTNNVVSTSWDPKQIAYQFSEQVKKLLKYSRRPCGCDTCILEQSSAWFEERFNVTIQPFLTTQNAFLPQENYRWWLKLQGERSPKTMNKAPTKGFELDVGSKTTHHFVYPESYRELGEMVNMILIPFKILDLRWVISALTNGTINHTYIPVPRKIKVNKDK
ncbi:CMP-N-acetylneuraminate-beta-galactosamide-alpha-2,3-sialyltransferase 1-like, partial [Protobothrops mucrosquamatus]|uniref:CMP-N-acetylneuraminate-beta-galactosamide- alpha-2,3-sialyltransferase 1-like n=1 Tax=Protobothrops mucrosquamatus TaxID=103944 RepID=UPI0007758246